MDFQRQEALADVVGISQRNRQLRQQASQHEDIVRGQQKISRQLSQLTAEQDRVAALPKCPKCKSPIEFDAQLCPQCKAQIAVLSFPNLGWIIFLRNPKDATTTINEFIQWMHNDLNDTYDETLKMGQELAVSFQNINQLCSKNSPTRSSFTSFATGSMPPTLRLAETFVKAMTFVIPAIIFYFAMQYDLGLRFANLINPDYPDEQLNNLLKWSAPSILCFLIWGILKGAAEKYISVDRLLQSRINTQITVSSLRKSLEFKSVQKIIDEAWVRFDRYRERLGLLDSFWNATQLCDDYAEENQLTLQRRNFRKYPFTSYSGRSFVIPEAFYPAWADKRKPHLDFKKNLISITEDLYSLCEIGDQSADRTTTLNPDRKGSTDSFANKAFSTISNAVRGKYDVEESSEAAPSEVQQKDTLWVMKPDGEIGGPFTKQYLRELKVSGKLPQGLTASRSKNGPWQKIS